MIQEITMDCSIKSFVSPVDDDGNACTNTCMTAAVSGVAVTDFGKKQAFAVYN